MAAQCRLRLNSLPGLRAPTRPKIRYNGHIARSSDPAANLEKQMFGEDFGARDPTAGEIESNFSEKNLWNWDTNHLIKAPDSIASLVGLAAKTCKDTPEEPVDEKERELLRSQVAGWRVEGGSDSVAIRRDWTAQGPEQAAGVKERLEALASSEEHTVDVTCVGSQVFAVLPAASSEVPLSRRDFVLAARINAVDLSDLEQKKRARFWA